MYIRDIKFLNELVKSVASLNLFKDGNLTHFFNTSNENIVESS